MSVVDILRPLAERAIIEQRPDAPGWTTAWEVPDPRFEALRCPMEAAAPAGVAWAACPTCMGNGVKTDLGSIVLAAAGSGATIPVVEAIRDWMFEYEQGQTDLSVAEAAALALAQYVAEMEDQDGN